MKIPDSFKKAQLKVFQDKTITRYNVGTTTNAIGEVKKDSVATIGTYKGNVHFDNFEQVQEEHGIRENIDMTVTTQQTGLAIGEIHGYGGKMYEIFKVIPNDSHYLLVARKWLSKSSTLISA